MSFVRIVTFKFLGAKIGKSNHIYGKVIVIGYFSKIETGEHVKLNYGVILNSRDTIKIGNNVSISSCAKIYTGRLDPKDRSRHLSASVNIGDNVWIGSGAIILGGVTIPDNTTIAAGTVVNKSLSIAGLYAGVPAALKKRLKD